MGDGHQAYPPVVWAAKFGHEEVVRLLLEKGAKLSRLALAHCAKTSKSIPVIKLLMEAGLDPWLCHPGVGPFRKGPSAFELAVGDDSVFRALIEGITDDTFRNDWKKYGTGSIRSALRDGWVPQFEIFLERGLKLGHAQAESDRGLFKTNDRSSEGAQLSLQFLADATQGGFDMLNYVSKHGLDCGDVLAKCPSPASSVLRVAIKKNDLRSVKFLLDKGAVVQNDWELFIAIKHMFESSADPQVTTQILNLLCANGADPNMKDSSETHTLLGEVSATWALEALIKCGANPLLPRGYGRTPLEQEVEHYYGTVENVSVLPQSRYVLELPTIQLRNLLESLRDKAQASKNWHIVRFSASLHPSTGYIPRHRQCMSRSKGV